MNKFLLVAVNSKYIHSNLAVYCLKAATKYSENVSIKEFSINNRTEDIIKGIYEEKPDVIGFSCYIWNISIIKEVIPELGKILKNVPIWLGGPEVTYNAEYYVRNFKNITGIMKGEGEQVFSDIMDCYVEGRVEDIVNVKGISMYKDIYIDNICPEPYDMSNMTLPYSAAGYGSEDYNNKIIYYESSRGCPFSCSYCLSSVDKRLRFKDTEKVLEDLKIFLDNKVALVKFVDRTFNCKREHSRKILEFIRDNDNGITCFHFEIAADLIEQEDIDIMSEMRPGLIQLEIGVQSTNPDTIKAIHRVMDIDKLRKNVESIHRSRNIHMHLDLIAGLPYEDYESFKKSFNDIYAMKPDNLQLGFLKLLYGSLMRDEADKYGIVAGNMPPYEVLYTNFISYDEILKLKQVENVLDMYYNSNMFANSLRYLVGFFETPFTMYEMLGDFYEKRYAAGSLPSKNGKYELIYDFASDNLNDSDMHIFSELLRFDMYLRENFKNLPSCYSYDKEMAALARNYSGERKLTKAEHIEIFDINPISLKAGRTVIYFDYLNRLFDNNAKIKILEEQK